MPDFDSLQNNSVIRKRQAVKDGAVLFSLTTFRLGTNPSPTT